MQVELELLAPARNKEIGIAAIDCGADAVYMAGPAFGARANAGNGVEDIEAACRHAHKFGARVYVTVNTILYDNELQEAFSLMEQCREAGCDAFIIQDMAIPAHFSGRKDFPPLFASTQCAIRTPEQARWLESMGLRRLILERELSLEEIRAIRKAVSADLEFFVHGALCVCYSGNCYLSEHLAGRSANRGECIQACRSRYDLTDSTGRIIVKDKALLSLKDLSLIDRLEDLADAGITSFKIEGRLKNISYVRNTVKAYSEALDRMISSHKGFRRQSFGKVSGGFIPDLDKTFNRGYTELALDWGGGNKISDRNWNSMDNATAIGERIGKAESVARKGDSMQVRIAGKTPLHNGDGLCFIGTSGVTGFRADVCQGNLVTAKYTEGLRKGTEIYRNHDTVFEKEIENNCPPRLLKVKTSIMITGSPRGSTKENGKYAITSTAMCENGQTATTVLEEEYGKAANRSLVEENFRKQICKTSGIYSFILENLACAGDMPFVPASSINSIRRALAEKLSLETARTPEYQDRGLSIREPAYPENSQEYAAGMEYKANCSNAVAAGIYGKAWGHSPEPAYEITHRDGAELMRTRYCIKRELGICPKYGGKLPPGITGPLFLTNNGRRLRLSFDCTRCEMIVTS